MAVLVLAAAVTLPLVARRGAVAQPIEFNHRKHTEELGLNCEFCHAYVRRGAHAGLPDAQTCSMCHTVPQGASEDVALGELECEVCHGAIAATERPPRGPLVEITMDFCMDCHREQGQTLDCNACHR
jgi:DnaJ-class molecular chaperone